MTHFFQKRDPWGNGMALWVIIGMVFLIPIAVWSVSYIQMENEVHQWVSGDNRQAKTYHWYKEQFPTDDAFLFTWEGSDLADPRIASFIAKIRPVAGPDGTQRGGIKQVKRVRSPHDLLAQIVKNDVSHADAISRLQGVLIGTGQLRIRLTETGKTQKAAAIQMLKKRALEDLGLQIVVSPAQAVPTAEEVAALMAPVPAEGQEAEPAEEKAPDVAGLAAVLPLNFEHDFQVRWDGIQPGGEQSLKFRELARQLRTPASAAVPQERPLIEDCFFAPGSPVALAITLSEAGLADRKETFRVLKEAAVQCGIPEPSIHMGGNGVSGAALNHEVLKSMWDKEYPIFQLHRRTVVGMSGLVGCVLAFWLLRSLRLAGLVLAVSYFTVLISVALVPMTGGTMNMVLVVMPTLLLVTTLSGAIHLANYWKHAAFRNAGTAVVEAVNTAFSPCVWASLTTAIGLASLMTSSLQPIRDFGLYSAIGTVISMLVVLYGLPSLLQMFPSQVPRPDELDSSAWRGFGIWLVRHHRAVIVGGLLVSSVSIYGLVKFKTETKVIRYFSSKTRIVQDYNFLEENIAGVVPVELILRFDQGAQEELRFVERVALIRKIQERVSALPDISGTLSLADFLPVVPPPPEKANVRQRALFAAKSKAIEERVKHNNPAAAALLTTAEKVTEYNAAGDELWRVTAQVAMMSELHYGAFTKQLDEICQSVLKNVSGETDEKFRAAKVPVAYHPGASHYVTGMVPLFLATQEELLASLVKSFILAFVTISLVMMVLLKHPVAGVLALVPNILPIGAVFGLIAWSGLAVDIGTVVTASVALGIAIDGTLHIITWFRLGIIEGKSRSEAVVDALCHCGPAMWQTSFVVGLGLLMLWPADLTLISRFGWLMASLIGGALVADIVLTPALLAGPLGAIIERCSRRIKIATPEAVPESVARRPREAAVIAKPHLVDPGVAARIRRID